MTTETKIRDHVAFALHGLPGMRLSDGMYCLDIHAHDMRPRGRSIRYSLIVALGLLRARAASYEVDPELDHLVRLLLESWNDPSLTAGDLGLLLWLDRRAGRDCASELLGGLERRLATASGLPATDGMELAWIAIGALECVTSGAPGPAERLLQSARMQLCTHNRSPSGLLLHRGVGHRRRFPNFATQIYGTLALSRIGRRGDQQALAVARGVADALLSIQRADGGWPWIIDAYRGRVVEPYELYTVHQDAMAPMALFELFEATGEDRYRVAALHGFEWIYGRNDLGRSMFCEQRQIAYRSIRRRSPWSRAMLYANTASAYVRRPFGAEWRTSLEIDPTDRPYHLGWVLEAWCGREMLGAAAPE